MSMLPAGQPLDRVLPDLDDLLADPVSYLSSAPLAIGPRRLSSYVWLFALPGLGLLISCLVQQTFDKERIAIGVGCLCGAFVFLCWQLLLAGHELILHPDGVEVSYRGTSVFAPWALFHVHGRAFNPDSDSPLAGLTLPINTKALPWVQLWRNDMVVAHGRDANGPQWQYNPFDEVILPARYEVMATDIGELLLLLGARLGGETPRGMPASEVDDQPQCAAPKIDAAGWITVPITRLRMPICCVRCGGPRDDTLRVQVMARGDWATGFFLGGMRSAEVTFGVCEPCKTYLADRQRRASTIGMVVGMLVGTGVGLGLGGYYSEGREEAMWLAGLAGLFLGCFFGAMIGMSMRRMPVRLKRYSPSRGVVCVRFENPEIAERVVGMMATETKAEEE